MSVTAARLGSAPITLDWTHLTTGHTRRVGSGTNDLQAWSQLRARFESGEVGFYQTPFNNELSQAQESQELAREILAKGQITDCLFLGIGGSSLGPLSLLSALKEKCTTKIRFQVLENPDPTDWKSTLAELNPLTTLVCVVTKSGTTFETMAQFLLALEWLGKDRWVSNIVAITDPAKGDLRLFATVNGIRTLSIAPSIGGRFSVFTPVGLFAAALAGLDVDAFLKGAKQVYDYIEKTPLEKNPLFTIGAELIAQFQKRPIHVCMPYSTRLKALSSWFVQIWGESLGKNGKGFTPIAALGATDQHSILQLLRDGPDDKITWFITVDKVADEVKIPHLARISGQYTDKNQYPAFKILEGHTLHELLTVEYRAISLVLIKQSRPQLNIQIETLDERSMGALYFMFATLTAITGTLWGVNPFDQPGVEEGKVYIRDSLLKEPVYGQGREEDENSAVARLRRGSGEYNSFSTDDNGREES